MRHPALPSACYKRGRDKVYLCREPTGKLGTVNWKYSSCSRLTLHMDTYSLLEVTSYNWASTIYLFPKCIQKELTVQNKSIHPGTIPKYFPTQTNTSMSPCWEDSSSLSGCNNMKAELEKRILASFLSSLIGDILIHERWMPQKWCCEE